MTDKNGLRISARDRLLISWQRSTELVRDYQLYKEETAEDERISSKFARYAHDEAVHAAELLEMLREIDG